MGEVQGVHASRSGDQYHYLWASLRALRLLDSSKDLHAISIEGPADGETVVGEEIIDVAEYYGGVDSAAARSVTYYQLKHSSVRIDDPMTSSELSTTLRKFARIYRHAIATGTHAKIQFSLVTNRVLSERVRVTFTEIEEGGATTHPRETRYLREQMDFGSASSDERDFVRRFKIDDGSAGIEDVQRVLEDEIQTLIPGGGSGGELAELMFRVSGMATHESRSRMLGLHDLLVTLRTTERTLLPAPPKLEEPRHVIRTADVSTVAQLLKDGGAGKLLLTALGGVGKSVFTSMLVEELSSHSTSLVFDCFAGGDYRDTHTKRHPHRVALTQLGNELAGRGLSTVIIPSQTADAADYLHAFISKVDQACERLALSDPESLLTVIIDAADNAALAAADYGEPHFVKDLFAVDWPDNFRLVALCRPERKKHLNIPSGVRELALDGFDRDATLEHLRHHFPDASTEQGAELHALSSGNPRVQAMAMEGSPNAAAAIAALAIAQARPGETLDTLLADQIQNVAAQGHLLPDELSSLCEALAILHPTIPLADLADITGLEPDAIRSFAVALGRGLFFNDHALQFRDEPTETWFRKNHLPPKAELRSFANRIAPLATDSPYIASILPQVYFEAEMLDELVQLALSGDGLPSSADDLQSQEIARSQTRFALGAALKARRNEDAALLAVKAGTLLSGHSRRISMIRDHPDLATEFLQAEVVETLTTGRELNGDWPGSNLHVEAVMLSHLDALRDLARSRFTSSLNTISAILRLRGDSSHHLRTRIGSEEIAALALAAINLDGPESAARFLQGWRPKAFVRETSAKLSGKLADAGRTDEVSELVVAAAGSKHLQLGCLESLFDYAATPSAAATSSVSAMLKARKKAFKDERGPYVYDADVRGVTWALLHGLRAEVLSSDEALRIANIHLQPLPNHVGERWSGVSPVSAIVLHALRARLEERDLTVKDVVHPRFHESLEKNWDTGKRDTRSFRANIPDLLPWATCLVDAHIDGPTDAVRRHLVTLATSSFSKVSDYDTPYVRVNGIAELAARILTVIPDKDVLERFEAWHETSDAYLGQSRISVIRSAARNTKLSALGIAVANRGVDRSQLDRTDADLRVDEIISLARAVWTCNKYEARAIFNIADAEAELVGSDLGARWFALTNSAQAIGNGSESERAHRLLEIGEELNTHGEVDALQLTRSLLAMDPKGYCAAISRQRDRRAVRFEQLLEPLALSAGSASVPLGALALFAFKPAASWKRAVSTLEPDAAKLAARVLRTHFRFHRSAKNQPPEPTTASSWTRGSRQKKPKPKRVAARYDYTISDAWDASFNEIEWYSEKREKLVNVALRKSPSALAEAVVALAAAKGAHESDFVTAARVLKDQKSTAGLRAALATLTDAFATRFAATFCTRWYERAALREFAAASGSDVHILMRTGFMELGVKAHALKHEECFSLASYIAQTLEHGPATRVFDSLANLFDDLAPPGGSPDGLYDPSAWPSMSGEQGLAGLIWTASGDMAARRRWQAAHAVLLLVQLGDAETLRHLSLYADGTHAAGPFGDPRFRPYELHSKLWMLMALERAASEPNAQILEPFVPWLQRVVDGPPHAASQVVAQRTLQALSSGLTTQTIIPVELQTRRLNADWIELEYGQRQDHPDPLKHEDPAEAESRGHPFFYDFQSYWGSHLARAFGTTEAAVAREAAAIAENLTGFDDDAPDPRRTARIFDSRSTPDHRSWPQEEDFTFYSAVHSLLTLGAKLALTEQALKEPGADFDDYTSWLHEYLPKRRDGRWLSDRRDPPPSPSPEWRLAGASQEAWAWSLSPKDFSSAAGYGTDWVTVSASYDSALGQLSEDVFISSALLLPGTARALLVALQTSNSGSGAGRLPTVRDYDDHEPGTPHQDFRLTPWIDDSAFREGIDEQDEMGRNLRYPPRRLSTEFMERFGLEPDSDLRFWRRAGEIAVRSQVWDASEQVSSDRMAGTQGQSLEISWPLLLEILAVTGLSLVLAVDCRRETHRPSYRRQEDDDELNWIDWSSKIYVIDAQGKWTEY